MVRAPIDVVVSARTQGVVVVGEFDGVHLRHRRLIALAQNRADQLGTPVFAIVLDTDPSLTRLSIPRRRCELLVSCGVSLAQVTSDSVDGELSDTVQRLRPAELLIDSESFAPLPLARFMAFLEQMNIPHSEPSTAQDGIAAISSRSIVGHVEAGNVEMAARMLGRSFEMVGVIEPRTALRHPMGFRSIQLWPDGRLVALSPGIYAGTVHVSRRRVAVVVSVGVGVHRGARGRTGPDPISVHTIGTFDALSDDEVSIDVVTRIGDPHPSSGSGAHAQFIDAHLRRVSDGSGSTRSNRDCSTQKNAESGSMP